MLFLHSYFSDIRITTFILKYTFYDFLHEVSLHILFPGRVLVPYKFKRYQFIASYRGIYYKHISHNANIAWNWNLVLSLCHFYGSQSKYKPTPEQIIFLVEKHKLVFSIWSLWSSVTFLFVIHSNYCCYCEVVIIAGGVVNTNFIFNS